MNREILFRGKRVSNGNWIEGYFVLLAINEGLKHAIHTGTDEGRFILFEVIPDTVGQFTGLCDKNGKKIFEGDIVKIVGDSNNDDWKDVNYVAQIVFIDGGFCAIDGTLCNYSFRRYGLSRCEFDLEVVGNIYDNPELLEEKL